MIVVFDLFMYYAIYSLVIYAQHTLGLNSRDQFCEVEHRMFTERTAFRWEWGFIGKANNVIFVFHM